MKHIVFLFYLFLLAANDVDAQDSKLRFSGIGQVGLLHAATEPSWQIQFIAGVRYKTFSAGIGTGIDAYMYKSVPLFADIRKNIFARDNTPFVYANMGTSYPTDDGSTNMWAKYSYHKGLYYDLGAGYSWSMKKGGDFIASIGFSQKKITEKMEYIWSVEPHYERMEFALRRLSIKAGLRF